MSAITFNPSLTSSPQNSFLLQTQGFVQGAFVDDPSSRLYLAGGTLASSVTVPVFPGMAIQELIPSSDGTGQGDNIALATSVATLSGFNVANQNYNAIQTPGNDVQQLGAGNTVMYFRLGSGARIQVQCTAALVSALEGGQTNQQVAWDFTLQKLVPFVSGTALPVKVLAFNSNSKVVNYVASPVSVTWTTGPAAIIQI
jgi:hypothetical protein